MSYPYDPQFPLNLPTEAPSIPQPKPSALKNILARLSGTPSPLQDSAYDYQRSQLNPHNSYPDVYIPPEQGVAYADANNRYMDEASTSMAMGAVGGPAGEIPLKMYLKRLPQDQIDKIRWEAMGGNIYKDKLATVQGQQAQVEDIASRLGQKLEQKALTPYGQEPSIDQPRYVDVLRQYMQDINPK